MVGGQHSDAETVAVLLESLILGVAATSQAWQITKFFHVPPHGVHPGHLYLRLEWGTPVEPDQRFGQ